MVGSLLDILEIRVLRFKSINKNKKITTGTNESNIKNILILFFSSSLRCFLCRTLCLAVFIASTNADGQRFLSICMHPIHNCLIGETAGLKCLTISSTDLKLNGSVAAKSASTFRLSSMPDPFKSPNNFEYVNPSWRAPALIF